MRLPGRLHLMEQGLCAARSRREARQRFMGQSQRGRAHAASLQISIH
jgi:hypothetical protein